MLRGAIFDMDGTILDSMGIWRNCGDNTLKSLGINTNGELAQASKGISIEGVAKLAMERYNMDISHSHLVELMWKNIHEGYSSTSKLKPGVLELFNKFQSENIKMVLATATDREYANVALEQLNISQYFSDILTCREVGADKDQPTIYEMALKSLDVPKSDVYIFEDALYAIVTAKNNGFYVVGVADEYSKSDAVRIKALCDYYLPEFQQWKTVLSPILS